MIYKLFFSWGAKNVSTRTRISDIENKQIIKTFMQINNFLEINSPFVF